MVSASREGGQALGMQLSSARRSMSSSQARRIVDHLGVARFRLDSVCFVVSVNETDDGRASRGHRGGARKLPVERQTALLSATMRAGTASIAELTCASGRIAIDRQSANIREAARVRRCVHRAGRHKGQLRSVAYRHGESDVGDHLLPHAHGGRELTEKMVTRIPAEALHGGLCRSTRTRDAALREGQPAANSETTSPARGLDTSVGVSRLNFDESFGDRRYLHSIGARTRRAGTVFVAITLAERASIVCLEFRAPHETVEKKIRSRRSTIVQICRAAPSRWAAGPARDIAGGDSSSMRRRRVAG